MRKTGDRRSGRSTFILNLAGLAKARAILRYKGHTPGLPISVLSGLPSMTLSTQHTKVHVVHQTPLGPMTSIWTDEGLFSLRWEEPADETSDQGGFAGESESQVLDDRLNEYFTTGHADFESIRLDTHGWTAFTEKVYRCCRAIASGHTLTYKELATRAGSEGASRAAGAAMARNRILLVIPCHRVVSAGGGLRGFSAPGGLQTKQFLLDLETA